MIELEQPKSPEFEIMFRFTWIQKIGIVSTGFVGFFWQETYLSIQEEDYHVGGSPVIPEFHVREEHSCFVLWSFWQASTK